MKALEAELCEDLVAFLSDCEDVGCVLTKRTGDELDVGERTASRQASPGQLLCGRAVPDGESRQFVGGLFGVPPGRESTLLDLLDPGDGLHLLEYVAARHRPPDLVCPTEAVGTWPA